MIYDFPFPLPFPSQTPNINSYYFCNMARPDSLMLLLLLLRTAPPVASFTAERSFAKLPSRVSPSSMRGTSMLAPDSKWEYMTMTTTTTHQSTSTIQLSRKNEEDVESNSSSTMTIYTPLDRPLLAIIDAISLTTFAAIGKSSHSNDGSLSLIAVLITAFPFITAWMVTSPLTGVYSPDVRDEDLALSTALKVGKGWALAIPIGIALRGVIKGYVPPVPFIIVTLISTLVILVGVRIAFSLVEDFFVEFV